MKAYATASGGVIFVEDAVKRKTTNAATDMANATISYHDLCNSESYSVDTPLSRSAMDTDDEAARANA